METRWRAIADAADAVSVGQPARGAHASARNQPQRSELVRLQRLVWM
jgi:hypothetical protein